MTKKFEATPEKVEIMMKELTTSVENMKYIAPILDIINKHTPDELDDLPMVLASTVVGATAGISLTTDTDTDSLIRKLAGLGLADKFVAEMCLASAVAVTIAMAMDGDEWDECDVVPGHVEHDDTLGMGHKIAFAVLSAMMILKK